MRKLIRFFCCGAFALYPIAFIFLLVVFSLDVRVIGSILLFISLVYFLALTDKRSLKSLAPISVISVFLCCATAGILLDSSFYLKFYPVLINAVMLFSFLYTIVKPPNMIFRFATLQDKTIKGSILENRVESYCRFVTFAWCVFFVINGIIAAFTITYSDMVWAAYNGFISYVLIGAIFYIELIVRKRVKQKLSQIIPLSKLSYNSRAPNSIVCYEGLYSEGKYLLWQDFAKDIAKIRVAAEKYDEREWVLHCEDIRFFSASFIALLQAKKIVMLTANISPAYIEEIKTARNGKARFLTDKSIEGAILLADLLRSEAPSDLEFPPIDAEKTKIILFTSGSTGVPKEVHTRLTELEADNAFILSKWGAEIIKRKLCSTIGAHHIYGLLYCVLLPLAAGAPFRRYKIDFAEEFEQFTDDSYTIITVPALLKRAAEILSPINLRLPMIFSSGGVLPYETANKINDIFGFWPIEIYGSTETSGIAYRQSINSAEWTPYGNVQININNQGCLVVKSKSIYDPNGYETSDLATIFSNGKFTLNGRVDNVVKIEGKRVSLAEIESRLIASGFIVEAGVIALKNKRGREYLACVIQLNEQGKAITAGMEIYKIDRMWRDYLSKFFELVTIPKRWRYVDIFPYNSLGKKRKKDMEKLFDTENENLPKATVVAQDENLILLEITLSPNCIYFDGHFPAFALLPALAQFDIAMRYAALYFNLSRFVKNVKRMKFINPILPNSVVRLNLRYNSEENSVSFTYANADSSKQFSAGKALLQ
jgi:acyl-coenzyme A synthetase/AMP-(fatty) acid ligase/uncharacterized membrane protein/3-hydroxymyristoyl/3-hydroxydecanoyl-(acyl carrier protein) dehydratase